ncbi:MAG: bifunctional UDP-N-acetylglucosamine diphosphorylase/glucosamine-1-phosphate N-acetyltransferase GlmU [Chloroflexi bacterium]|jgi:bifunctional UDP-N-acetylglucosamine pyrophosphorylase/glucosamine-1-phosphate N-acetyltransferase|nr:bifunctional UDP-N-acetylglucosamine diphosphorylase/glucosamine-1-phosphate N-acetyltransferase GlmU [Chloroflexota bacterium]
MAGGRDTGGAAGTTVAVVLAAGLGTRMRSRVPKVLHPLLGRPMLAYVLAAAEEATGSRPLVVYSPPTDRVRETFAAVADFVLQDEPRGTGDAVRAALGALPAAAADLVVLSGDVPLVAPELIAELAEARRSDRAVMTLVTFEAIDPGRLGRVIRDPDDEDAVLRIVEAKDATAAELGEAEVNAGLYAFDAAWLRARIGDLRPSPATGELYLTELAALARAGGRRVTAFLVDDDGTLAGINDRQDLADAASLMGEIINVAHMRAGVTMEDPSTAYVDATVELATDVVLEPNVILRGATRIGEGTRIGAGTRIVDSVVGRDCEIVASVLEEAEVEDDVRVGPFAHLRRGSSIGRGARLGNYAEVKNSRIGPGVQQHHFSYIGDAEVGERTNIGAGTITANYDGKRKHRTTIGARAFIGSDTMLVAPVTVGDDASTGAGSVVTHDVPAGMVAVGVPARLREPRAAGTGGGGAGAPGAPEPGVPEPSAPPAGAAPDGGPPRDRAG